MVTSPAAIPVTSALSVNPAVNGPTETVETMLSSCVVLASKGKGINVIGEA